MENYKNSVAILIPTLNPDEKMVKYIKELSDIGFQKIILVDDGSREDTEQYFKEAQKLSGGGIILRHAINQGKGRALKTGFNYLLNTYDESEIVGVVTADSDGQHSVIDTENVAKALWTCASNRQDQSCLVLGIRNFNEKNVPFKSRFGNKITTLLFSIMHGKRIQDTQTGLRGISYSYMQKCLQLAGERFEYEIAMLIDSVRENAYIKEVIIDTIYINDNRETHFDAVRDSFRIYKVLLGMFFKYALSSLLSFLIDVGLFAFLTKLVFVHSEIMRAVFFSSIIARFISSQVNFWVNKEGVFKSSKAIKETVLKYYLLCVFQICCSVFFVVAICKIFLFDTTIIKIIVDSLLFLLSYQIQRNWVFNDRRNRKNA